ncbi:MAG: 1,6-anhydro-N-acetylmuramyl-L-alanine amidase AmpD [Gammaproteobacteria bacterium]|nr:1,6-anhydro-N-acetylmuramyl-L-alanine amidase AmpD [Gammaproteobacteria bacterium]
MQTNFSVLPDTGLIEPAAQCASPNQDARPAGVAPAMVVVHGISLPPGEFGGSEIEALFTNTLDFDAHPYFDEIRGLTVSAHLLIRRDGALTQFVPFTMRAWHAGESCFRGQFCCNDYSIGIELEGEDETAYDDRQYVTLQRVLSAIFDAYPAISAREVAGHCDIAPGRKSDPGPAFDWLRLYDGLGAP